LIFSLDLAFQSEIDGIRQSKNVTNFIPIKFCFLGKPLDINSLDELIVLGIEIAHISTIKKS